MSSQMMVSVRRAVLIGLSTTFAAAAAMAADTQVGSEVTVQAERPAARTVGRSASGIPIVLSSVQYRVNYSDLELSIPSNAKVLETRVRDAARAACADLDRLYAQPTSGPDDCSRKATETAMPQVLSAIAAAEARKTAAD
jgi:UrcA family protein